MTPVPRPKTRTVYTDVDFISTNRSEAAVLIASGFVGQLIHESPFEMRFPSCGAARR